MKVKTKRILFIQVFGKPATDTFAVNGSFSSNRSGVQQDPFA